MALDHNMTIDNNEDTQKGRFLTFILGEEAFGIHIQHVMEIVGMHPITHLPEVPSYIKGIINLRSKIIPVIDMRLKFKKPPIEYDDRTCIIVVNVQDMVVGLIVDTVAEVISIDTENIVPPPESSINVHNNYLSGIGMVEDEVKLLLDCERLLQQDDADKINEINMGET